MLKKLIVGLLAITLVGGAAVALLDNQNTAIEAPQPTAARGQGGGQGNAAQQNTPQPVQASTSSVGDPWSGVGTILELGTVGMTLALEDGQEIFVELGSPDYWQAQDITLNAGAVVTIDGFFNGTDYHARTVTTSDGAILALRNEQGQPLWAGGSSSAGENGGQGQVQIPADQWVTVEGVVTALTNNGLVLQTSDGGALTVSFGRADFWQGQAVTFATDDAVALLGFWQGDQFSVGQATRTATGERILLRDPNGRPLWAGPGRGQGNGQGTHLTPTAEATPEATAPVAS
ncbi:MAG: hypothetical protein JNL42_14775 [Anaerolineae bacterium]|nr:hypothetical protein [Anaerolineae bacterium]